MCTYLNRTGAKYYFRRPVPKDLLGYFKTSTGKSRKEWKYSLGTSDRTEAKPLLRPFEIETDELIAIARQGQPVRVAPAPQLTSRQKEEVEAATAGAAAKAARREARREIRTLLRQRMQLSTAELRPEEAAARDLIRERDVDLDTLRKKVEELEVGNNAIGGTSTVAQYTGKHPVSVMEVFEDWAQEFGKPDTVAAYKSYIGWLDKFLEYPDANNITEDDISDWRNELRTKGGLSGKKLSNNTINGAYMAAVAAVFEHGSNATRRLSGNPAAKLKALRTPKRTQLRAKSISDDEAIAILTDAMQSAAGGVTKQRQAAKRWCAWLMAYSGARVLEIAQLRREDIGVACGVAYIHITPEAGKNKTDTARKVPIHPHLIQQGFLDFVALQEEGPLFYDPSIGRGGRLGSQAKKVGYYLANQVRALGIDVAQPNHGWRHRMETMNNRYDLRDKIVRMILGHSGPDSNADYGDEELMPMLREIRKLPAYLGPGLPPFDMNSDAGS